MLCVSNYPCCNSPVEHIVDVAEVLASYSMSVKELKAILSYLYTSQHAEEWVRAIMVFTSSVLVVMAQLVYAPVVTQIITRMDCVISLSQAPYSVQLISTLNKMSVALQPDVFFSFSGTQGAVSIDSPQSEYVFLPL